MLPAYDYLIHISRANQRPRGWVWPIRLPQRLPVIGIPLAGEDPDAPLDLQAVLTTAYERGAYDVDLNNKIDPIPPLPDEHAAWADALLRERGLR